VSPFYKSGLFMESFTIDLDGKKICKSLASGEGGGGNADDDMER
jgi:hypothetical protein